MDSSGFRNIKAEKANALLRYGRLQRVTTMFRLLELCVFLITLSRFTTHLPAVVKLSGDYFRGISVTGVSPLFVFFIGNAIVIVLFLKSGQSKGGGDCSNPINDLYDEYAKNCEKNRYDFVHEIKKEKKQRRCTSGEVCWDAACNVKERKMCRSRSENLKRLQHHKEGGRELRRSVTERRQQKKSVDLREEQEKGWCPEDEMSNEEFRRTIEAFIDRQQRALREEEFSSDLNFL